LFAWTAIALHSGASSTAAVLTVFLTITNIGAAIAEVVNDAMIAEAGKNRAGAQHGMESPTSSFCCSIQYLFTDFLTLLLL
jgi:MFS-type transporter involved in bile tolerance (Atg22 family)